MLPNVRRFYGVEQIIGYYKLKYINPYIDPNNYKLLFCLFFIREMNDVGHKWRYLKLSCRLHQSNTLSEINHCAIAYVPLL